MAVLAHQYDEWA